jgi:hypothetical protein
LTLGGSEFPAPFNTVTDALALDEISTREIDVIDDKMILTGHIYQVESFMHAGRRSFHEPQG